MIRVARSRIAVAMGLAAVLAGCSTHPPRARAVAAAAPPPTLVLPPAATDWRDVPLTPGGWRYLAAAEGSRALYGLPERPVLVVRCDLAAHRIRVELPGAAMAGPLSIRTSSGSRALAAEAVPGGGIGAGLAARDPFLDELAFSRGRISVSAPNGATLYVPAWAEPARVIEDCRG